MSLDEFVERLKLEADAFKAGTLANREAGAHGIDWKIEREEDDWWVEFAAYLLVVGRLHSQASEDS